MSLKTISIFGSTGSVGVSTVDIVISQPERFAVQTVTANTNVALLAEQAKQLNAGTAVIADKSKYAGLKELLAGTDIKVAAGREALLEEAARPHDLMVAAIVGFAGLEPLMKAVEQGINVAIANKEPLVAAGPQVVGAAKKSGAKLLPVDSEHNAIFQVFEDNQRQAIERIILTASGGPFRTWTAEEMAKATPEQAVAHPNWSMGQKISVDSATLMNKALEVIEARYLFDMAPDKIDVVIHPQSIIHSMVEYADGSVLAQMGAPDMKTPIAYCLGWPERIASPGQKLDFTNSFNIDIEPIDFNRFKSVKLAYECLEHGQEYCLAFNAANEVAVQAFLEGRISFPAIVDTVADILEKTDGISLKTVADVVLFNETVRTLTESYINGNIAKKEASAA